MSKTYKHIAKYKQREYWRNYPFRNYELTEWVFLGEDMIAWRSSPPPKVPKEPFPWYWHGVDDKSKQAIEKQLQRRFRHKVKRMIHQGKYDDLPLKPENSAWILW